MAPQAPLRLYKYRDYSARTLTALKTRTLWFGPPSGLNDPFDCDIPLQFAPVTMDGCKALLAAESTGYWATLRNDARHVDSAGQPTALFREAVERAGRAAFEEALHSRGSLGITCFSEVPNDTLLWSHYGGGHRGICLEFDTSSPWLTRLHQVAYSDQIPQVDLIALLLGDSTQVLAGLLTKAGCWAYEREWRAIHKDAGTEYCYGVEALTGVYLGAALGPGERDLVAHILHSCPTKLYIMRRSSESLSVTPEAATYVPYRHPPSGAV